MPVSLRRFVCRLTPTIRVALLIALCFRALLPVGFMPANAAVGDGMEIVICTGMGAKTIVVDADGVPVPAPSHEDQTESPCIFASILHAHTGILAPDVPPCGVASPTQELPVQAFDARPAIDYVAAQPRAPPYGRNSLT